MRAFLCKLFDELCPQYDCEIFPESQEYKGLFMVGENKASDFKSKNPARAKTSFDNVGAAKGHAKNLLPNSNLGDGQVKSRTFQLRGHKSGKVPSTFTASTASTSTFTLTSENERFGRRRSSINIEEINKEMMRLFSEFMEGKDWVDRFSAITKGNNKIIITLKDSDMIDRAKQCQITKQFFQPHFCGFNIQIRFECDESQGSQ